MKKVIFLITMLCITGLLFGQKYTSIRGYVKGDKIPSDITLFNVADGSIHVYATTKVAADGSYGFLFQPAATGFYTVGNDQMSHVIYVKGGEEINLNILENKAELSGKNTKENVALYQWEDFSANIRLKSVYFMKTMSTFKDFFPEFVEFVAEVPQLKKKVNSGNKAFDDLLRKKIDYDVDYYAVIFLQTPRTAHPERSDRPEFYGSIVSADKFTTDDVLVFPYGVRMLGTYLQFAFGESGDKNYDVDKLLTYLKNDRLKGEYVLTSGQRYKSYDQYLSMQKKYGQYFVTPSQKARAEEIGTKLYTTAPGSMAADFTYPDIDGKEVSLSDFKGKVVLVDVWATWCGPCRGEIPHLKKLEQEMHGKDVVFIGVSVDESKDKQKWIDFVKKEELQGVQLLASGWSKITKDYQIKGIPRFMVFDKNGNIVSVDAPRPSSPELKQLLEEELKK